MLRTVRYACRALAARPGVSAGIILSLALAIGANTAIFGLADEILWKPLPVRQPERLAAVYGGALRDGAFSSTSYADYLDYRDGTRDVFSDLAAYLRLQVTMQGDAAGQGEGQVPSMVTERIAAEYVTTNYFAAMGVDPLQGRTFLPDDESTARPVALVSERLWRRAPQAGRSILVNGEPLTVVGIIPAQYKGPLLDWTDPPDVWIPLSQLERTVPPIRGSGLLTRRELRSFMVIGRLRDGVEPGAAQAAVRTVAARLAVAYPQTNEQVTAHVLPARQANFWPGSRPAVTRSLALFGGAVGLVLLLACTNVANLLLERASARRKEIALRLALGASRGTLVRQLMTESLLLALCGAAAGLALARIVSTVLASSTRPLGAPLTLELPLDYRALAFTALLSLVTAVLFGLVPALRASRADLVSALKGTTRAADPASRLFTLPHMLVMAQVAMSLVLLVCGGLFVRSLLEGQAADPGFRADKLATIGVSFAPHDVRDAQKWTLMATAQDRLRALPGVEAVTMARLPPFGRMRIPMTVSADSPAGGSSAPAPVTVETHNVGAGYLRTVGIPLLGGREIEAHDLAAGAPVVVINDTLARQLWGHAPAVGRYIRRLQRNGPPETLQVIGVAKTAKYHGLWEAPIPVVYQPLPEGRLFEATLLVRAADPGSLAPAVRDLFSRLDPSLPAPALTLWADQLALSMAPQRTAASLLGVISMTALVLASVGLYGVLAYAVAQRTREIGLRIALGAEPSRVLRQMVGRGLLVAGIGLAVGLGLAWLVTPLLATLIPGVTPTDPMTFASVGALLLLVAFAASAVPASRAARIDPLKALRTE